MLAADGERPAILAAVRDPIARVAGREPDEEWVKIAGIEFDTIDYDRDVDVLYLHVGSPSTAVDWDEIPEGDGTRYGADGSLVGITILNARRRLERDGKIVITLPEQRVEATDLDEVLAPA